MQHGCGMGAVCEQIGSKRDKSKQRLAPHPTQREKWSGGAASAGGRPLCVVRGFSDTALHSEAQHETETVTRGTARRYIFFSVLFS